MDVTDERGELLVARHGDRAVAALEEMADAFMARVEIAAVPAAQPMHHARQRPRPGSQHEVHVIGHQGPREARHAVVGNDQRELLAVSEAIVVVSEDRVPAGSSHDHVMDCAGMIDGSSTRQVPWIQGCLGLVQRAARSANTQGEFRFTQSSQFANRCGARRLAELDTKT